MASSKIKGITIKIGADTQGLDTALKSVESKGKEAAKELREIKTAMNNAGESAKLWAQKQEVLSTALDESKKKLKLLEDAQAEVNKQFQNKNITEEQYRAFERETEYARAEVAKYEKQLDEANRKVEEFGRKSDEAAKDVDELGDNTEEAGKQAQKASDGGLTAMKVALGSLIADGLRAAGGAVKDFTKDVVETGMVYESSMSNVAAISGATAGELEQLEAKAEEMGATTKFTASEAADAFGYMALAGWNVNDMLSGIDGVLDLAAASSMDLATASDIVTDYLTAFGLSAQDSGHFVDVMTYAMANSNTTTAMLGEAYKSCAATASSMGYSVEDTTAVLMTMANAGIKGSEAGTALNAIMTRLATDTKNCATELGEYGVEIYDTQGEMQSLSSILKGVSGVWENLNDQQQASMAKAIAGTNHYAALQTIMNGLSEQAEDAGMSFSDYTAALEECDGAAQDMSTTMIDNLAGDMTILDSAVDGMKISLSKELNPALRDIVQYVTKEMPTVQKQIEPVAKTAVSALEFVIKNTPTAVKVAKGIIPIVTGIGAAFAAWKVASVVQGAATAMQALNLAMLANPAVAVTAVVVALTAAIAYFAIKSNEQKDATSQVTKEYEAEFEAIQNTREAMGKLREEYSNNADNIVKESDRTRELWKELDNLTDSSGRVLDKDKERAQYILGELNKALGTEYTMTDNQIDGYRKLSAEIDNVIAKKEAELLLDQYRTMEADNIKLAADAKSRYQTANTNRKAAYAERDTAVSNFQAKLKEQGLESNMSIDEYLELRQKQAGGYYSYNKRDPLYAEIEAVKAANSRVANENTLYREAHTDYITAMSYMDKLDEASTAYYEGRYGDLKDILYAVKDADREILESGEGTFDELNTAYQNLLDKSLSDLDLALDSGRQKEIDSVLEAMETTYKLGKQAGTDTSDIFSDEFIKGVQEMVDKGFDISKLAAWAKDSGIDVGDIFGDEYIEIVQKQLDHDPPFDINDLLIWGMNSGIDVGKLFTDEFTAKYQAALNSGFDISLLLEWAAEQGYNVGEVFGDNYKSVVTRYIYATNDLINENSINSESDAYYARQRGAVSWSHNATGTFMNIGHEGIIAEAGPELLQVMNGGVRVTPLTREARNTPVSLSEQGGGQKVVYETINVYAQVSSDYDVRLLGERLAAEKKSVEIAKGI